jgi:RNA polymerase sigma-70 factor (ECF subfamily)
MSVSDTASKVETPAQRSIRNGRSDSGGFRRDGAAFQRNGQKNIRVVSSPLLGRPFEECRAGSCIGSVILIIIPVMTDEQLIMQLKEGNSNALDELYMRYAKKLYVFLSNLMKVPDPEDMVHDVFIRVIEKASQFDPGKASFRTWMFRIAHNQAVNLYRHQKIVKFSSMEQNIGLNETGRELYLKDTLEEENPSLDESGLMRAVRQCIEELRKDVERRALLLYHILEKNYEELSEVFQKSVSAVRKYVIAADEKLKICLERKGYGPGRGE